MKIIVFGASRGVGRCVVERALSEGHAVTAAVRTASSMTLAHDRLTVVECDARDAQRVESVLAGHDAVVVAIGDDSKGPTTLYSTAATNVAAAMTKHGVTRLVFLSNFGVLGERGRGIGQTLLLWMITRMLRPTLDDHRRALDVLRASSLDWTAVRAVPLINGARTGRYRVVESDLPAGGSSISRADVADFIVRESAARAFVRKTPAIAY